MNEDVTVTFDEGTRIAIKAAYLLGATHAVKGGLLGTNDIVRSVASKLRDVKSAING